MNKTTETNIILKLPGPKLTKKFIDFKKLHTVVNRQHAGIRKFLGKDSLSKKYHYDKDTKIELPTHAVFNSVRSLINDIEYLVPGYFTYYEINADQLLNPTINGVRTNKHLLTYYDKNFKDGRYYTSDRRHLSMLLDQVRQTCSEYGSIKAGKYSVTIDTTTSGFAKLGHYLVDRGCFANNGCNWHHKYRLAVVKNTFVMTLKKNKSIVGRCFGILGKRNTNFALTNFYFRGVGKGTLLHFFKRFCSDIKDTPLMFNESELVSEEEFIYVNNDSIGIGKSEKELLYRFEDQHIDYDPGIEFYNSEDYDENIFIY